MARKKQRESVTVAIRIESVKVGCMFGKPISRVDRGPYAEFMSLKCSGVVEQSKDFKTGPADVVILGSSDMDRALDAEKPRDPPLAVGEFNYRKGVNYALISLPLSILFGMAYEIREGRLPYFILRGPRERGGSIAVHTIAFDTADSLEDHGLEH